VFIALVYLWLFLPAGTNAGGFSFSLEENTISIRAAEVPLQEILYELEQAGISVRADPGVNPLITVFSEEVDLEEGIARILQDVDHVLVWKKNPAADGDSSLAEIFIFKEKTGFSAAALHQEQQPVIPVEKPPQETTVVIEGDRIFVPVTLVHRGKRVETTLVLDTGATTTILHEDVAYELGLDDFVSAQGFGVGGIPIETKATRMDSMSVGPHHMNDLRVDVIAYQRPGEKSFSGLLGMNFLKGRPFTVDYTQQVITWGE